MTSVRKDGGKRHKWRKWDLARSCPSLGLNKTTLEHPNLRHNEAETQTWTKRRAEPKMTAGARLLLLLKLQLLSLIRILDLM